MEQSTHVSKKLWQHQILNGNHSTEYLIGVWLQESTIRWSMSLISNINKIQWLNLSSKGSEVLTIFEKVVCNQYFLK